MTAIRVFAPAKINLALHVGPTRKDGRHPLQSVVMFADVGDMIRVEDGDGVSVSGPFAAGLEETPKANLAFRGLHLAGSTGAVSLEKNLPIASGIGGGSADAAAAMRAGNARLTGRFSPEEMEKRAFALGADVPVCVRSVPAFMQGAGEKLTPLALPNLQAVLVNPGVAITTVDAFRTFDTMGLGGDFAEDAPPTWTTVEEVVVGLKQMRNDLEAPARSLAPEVSAVLDRLAEAPQTLLARMSGSGATCFALTRDCASADQLAASLIAEQPTWWVKAVTLGAVDVAPRWD